MGIGVCDSCGGKGFSTQERGCTGCDKTIFVCMRCTAAEANMRRPVQCKLCQKIGDRRPKKDPMRP